MIIISLDVTSDTPERGASKEETHDNVLGGKRANSGVDFCVH